MLGARGDRVWLSFFADAHDDSDAGDCLRSRKSGSKLRPKKASKSSRCPGGHWWYPGPSGLPFFLGSTPKHVSFFSPPFGSRSTAPHVDVWHSQLNDGIKLCSWKLADWCRRLLCSQVYSPLVALRSAPLLSVAEKQAQRLSHWSDWDFNGCL